MQQPVVPNKVFVGGIPRAATEDDLLKSAQTFGKIKYVKLIKSLTTSAATFGFVSFWQEASAQKMIAASVKIRGKIVDCKVTKEYESLREANDELLRRKLYIGGFSKYLNEADIIKLFETIAQVEQVIINKDLQSGKSRGSGFVVFKTEAACLKVAQSKITEIAKQRMIVLPCKKRGQINKGLQSQSANSTFTPQTNSDNKNAIKLTSQVKISSFRDFKPQSTGQRAPITFGSNLMKGSKVSSTANQLKEQVRLNHFHENLQFNYPKKVNNTRLPELIPFTIDQYREAQESSESPNNASKQSS